MSEHAVVIVGAGPTGLMLAGELSLAGVDAVIVERRPDQGLDGSRAGGLHARTLEVLAQRGLAERFVAEGKPMPVLGFVGVTLDLGDVPTRFPYALALAQRHFERILAAWVESRAVPILRGREVVDLTQDADGVTVALADGSSLRAAYVVGCDGGRSVVRKRAGIAFVGCDASTSWIIAEVAMRDAPVVGMRREGGGIGPAPGGPEGTYRVVLVERTLEHARDPDLDALRGALVAAYGTDFGAHDPTWISRFSDMTRQAESYRAGRVLLAGDAAHVHPPQGGQGLNTGVQDAVNLGWKLAQVVHGISPDSLLETYQSERHPVGARVLQNTMAQSALGVPDERHEALRAVMREVLSMDEPRRRYAAMIAGLDLRYELGDGHPLVGRRAPDLDLRTADGATRVSALLHDARPVLLVLDDAVGDALPPTGAVRRVDARAEGPWSLPLVGEVPAPGAVLIRPDGYVAWAGDPGDAALPQAMTRWFGAADLPR